MNMLLMTQIENNTDSINVSEGIDRLRQLQDTFFDKLIAFGIGILTAVIIFVIGRFILKYVRRFVNHLFVKSKGDEGVARFVDSVVKVLGYMIILIIIFGKLGVETASLVTLLGTAGLSIGLALQGSLSNFAGGVLLLISKPFKTGDYVKINDNEGFIDKIDLIYTTLRKFDNRLVRIPNSVVSSATITNYFANDEVRADINVGISYNNDIETAKEHIFSVFKNSPYVLGDKNNDVAVTDFGDSDVTLQVRAWVKKEDYFAAMSALRIEIKKEFENNGISIPFNQIDVHIVGEGEDNGNR